MSQEKNLHPITRKEKILDGQDLAPVTRLEYFLKKAATKGEGGGGGADIYIGTIITMADVPPLPEGYAMADIYEELTQNSPALVVVRRSSDSDNSDSHETPVAYPSMQEAKPAFLKGYDGSNFRVFTSIAITDAHSEMMYPLVEDISQNRAYLTLNTAVPIFAIEIENGGVVPIEKTNLKWVLCDPSPQ